jgi:hypothetical protein
MLSGEAANTNFIWIQSHITSDLFNCEYFVGKIKEETKFQPIRDTRYQPVDINDFLPLLNGDLLEYVEQLMTEK